MKQKKKIRKASDFEFSEIATIQKAQLLNFINIYFSSIYEFGYGQKLRVFMSYQQG